MDTVAPPIERPDAATSAADASAIDTSAGDATAGAAPPGSQRRLYFVADTPDGPLRLTVDVDAAAIGADGAPPCAAVAAIALDRCDALLAALDRWLNRDLDWRWQPGAAPAVAAGTARCMTPAGAARLHLPWPLLRAAGTPDAPLAGQLDWDAAPAVLAISRPPLTDADLALLEPGGAVILPESLAAGWHGRLRAADEPADAGVAVALAGPGSPAPPSTAAATDAAGAAAAADACHEVRLALPGPLAVPVLAGWPAGMRPAPDLTAAAALWRDARDGEPARQLAAGTLLPWGDGWILTIASLAE
ncbi:MAG: hypothetical protein AB7G13_02605 [Lautropia sp.]